MKKSLLLSIFLIKIVASSATVSWADSLLIDAHATVSGVTNEDLNPLWLYSNEWGRYTQYDQAEGTLGFNFQWHLLRTGNRQIDIEIGVGADANAKIKNSFIHNAYLSAKIYMFTIDAGLRPFTAVSFDDQVSTGPYLLSSNARPQPRVGVAIYDYWSIPGTRDWIQLKGACYVGKLFNEDNDLYTKDVITHDKYVYGRLGGWYLKPYIGLIHSALMGGTSPDGTEIPLDFWATFFAKGSEKFRTVYRGESTNAAGAHNGMWDMGFDIDVSFGSFKIYLNRIFTAGHGSKPWSMKNGDAVLGLYGKLNNKHFSRFDFEYFTTKYGGGDSPCDPTGVDKNGKTLHVYPGDIPSDDPRGWCEEHFEEDVIEAWEAENGEVNSYKQAREFIGDMWDWHQSGRKTFLNNYLYFQGWSVHGLSSGTPLFHSYTTVDKYRKGKGNVRNSMFFTNNRVRAFNFALAGDIIDKLDYRVKYTWSKNFGSYNEKYVGDTWTLLEDYFYETPKVENYLLFDFNYQLPKNFNLRLTIATDFGELYSSTGARIGVTYKFER